MAMTAVTNMKLLIIVAAIAYNVDATAPMLKLLDKENTVTSFWESIVNATLEQHLMAQQRYHYRLPRNVIPVNYNLVFRPDFSSNNMNAELTLSIEVLKPTKKITLHASDLTINSIIVKNEYNEVIVLTNYVTTGDDREFLFLYFVPKIGIGNYSMIINYEGKLRNRFNGLRNSNNVRMMVASKFQPTYARQAFPCFDEPDFKATFDITLVKPKHLIALSNMNIKSVEPAGPNTDMVSFETSLPMSTYLASFVICDFDFLEVEINSNGIGKNFNLRTFAQKNEIYKIDFALDIGKRATEFYIKYYKVPFPLPKLDMIGIPDYISGATEHWGLITFRETAFLIDKDEASSQNKVNIAGTIAHELAHMWFGNLVTIKWWDDIWLNEGFATYMQFKALDNIEPSWDMLDQFLIKVLHPVLDTDSRVSSHPVVQIVSSPDDITAIFDSISYYKGASIVRMLEHFIGPEDFQKGISEYLMKYQFKNTITEDLLNSLNFYITSKYPYLNLIEVMDTWTKQSGYPLVTLEMGPDARTCIISQKQFIVDPEVNNLSENQTNRHWSVPVTFKTNKEESVGVVWLPNTGDKVMMKLSSNIEWIKLNINQVGYYRVNYPIPMWEKLISLLKNKSPKLSVSDRANLLNDVFALAEAGEVPFDIALNLSTYLIVEEDYVPWEVASKILINLAKRLKSSLSYVELQAYIQNLVSLMYKSLSWRNSKTNLLDGLVRSRILALATYAELPEAKLWVQRTFMSWLNAKGTANAFEIEPDLREIVYYNGMKGASMTEWEKLWEIYMVEKDVQELVKLRQALAAPRNVQILKQYLKLAWDENNVRSQDYLTVMQYIAANDVGTPLVWAHVRRHWPDLITRFSLNNRYLGQLIPAITADFDTQEQITEMLAFFTKFPEAGAGENARRAALERVRQNIRWASIHRTAIERWLEACPLASYPVVEPVTSRSFLSETDTSVPLKTTPHEVSTSGFSGKTHSLTSAFSVSPQLTSSIESFNKSSRHITPPEVYSTTYAAYSIPKADDVKSPTAITSNDFTSSRDNDGIPANLISATRLSDSPEVPGTYPYTFEPYTTSHQTNLTKIYNEKETLSPDMSSPSDYFTTEKTTETDFQKLSSTVSAHFSFSSDYNMKESLDTSNVISEEQIFSTHMSTSHDHGTTFKVNLNSTQDERCDITTRESSSSTETPSIPDHHTVSDAISYHTDIPEMNIDTSSKNIEQQTSSSVSPLKFTSYRYSTDAKLTEKDIEKSYSSVPSHQLTSLSYASVQTLSPLHEKYVTDSQIIHHHNGSQTKVSTVISDLGDHRREPNFSTMSTDKTDRKTTIQLQMTSTAEMPTGIYHSSVVPPQTNITEILLDTTDRPITTQQTTSLRHESLKKLKSIETLQTSGYYLNASSTNPKIHSESSLSQITTSGDINAAKVLTRTSPITTIPKSFSTTRAPSRDNYVTSKISLYTPYRQISSSRIARVTSRYKSTTPTASQKKSTNYTNVTPSSPMKFNPKSSDSFSTDSDYSLSTSAESKNSDTSDIFSISRELQPSKFSNIKHANYIKNSPNGTTYPASFRKTSPRNVPTASTHSFKNRVITIQPSVISFSTSDKDSSLNTKQIFSTKTTQISVNTNNTPRNFTSYSTNKGTTSVAPITNEKSLVANLRKAIISASYTSNRTTERKIQNSFSRSPYSKSNPSTGNVISSSSFDISPHNAGPNTMFRKVRSSSTFNETSASIAASTPHENLKNIILASKNPPVDYPVSLNTSSENAISSSSTSFSIVPNDITSSANFRGITSDIASTEAIVHTTSASISSGNQLSTQIPQQSNSSKTSVLDQNVSSITTDLKMKSLFESSNNQTATNTSLLTTDTSKNYDPVTYSLSAIFSSNNAHNATSQGRTYTTSPDKHPIDIVYSTFIQKNDTSFDKSEIKSADMARSLFTSFTSPDISTTHAVLNENPLSSTGATLKDNISSTIDNPPVTKSFPPANTYHETSSFAISIKTTHNNPSTGTSPDELTSSDDARLTRPSAAITRVVSSSTSYHGEPTSATFPAASTRPASTQPATTNHPRFSDSITKIIKSLPNRLSTKVKPLNYNIILNPIFDSGTFTGNIDVTVQVNEKKNYIVLHSHLLVIGDVKVFHNEIEVPVAEFDYVIYLEKLIVTFKDELALGIYHIIIDYNGDLSRNLVGLYASHLKNNRTILASKFQPTYARQAFPCFDEPEFKATFDITIVKPKNLIALSNMNVKSVMPHETDSEIVTFATSVSMSTYLACFVVCDFEYKEDVINTNGVGKNFNIRSYAQGHQLHKIDFALDIGKRATEYYIKYFKVPYPLPKLDMIAIPDYVSGATEHWGIITYRETSFLVDEDETSTQNKISVANTIAHELAHMWLGNLVTCKWWNEIWLNEGFASYMQFKALQTIEPSWNVMDHFVLQKLQPVLKQDSKNSSHPLIQDVSTADEITALFDSITYSKGAAILRMIDNLIGAKKFQQAITDYIKNNEFGNTVSEDLIAALNAQFEHSLDEVNFTKMVDSWTKQQGYPLLTVEEGPKKKIIITQSKFPVVADNKTFDDSQPNPRWIIPITFTTNKGESSDILWFQDTSDSVHIELDTDEKWIKLNNNQVGYYRVTYSLKMWNNLIEELKNKKVTELSSLDRAQLIDDVFALAEAEIVSYDLALNLTGYLVDEEDYVPWATAASAFNDLKGKLRNTEAFSYLQVYVQRLLMPLYKNMSWGDTEMEIVEGLLRTQILTLATQFELPEAQNMAETIFKKWLNAASSNQKVVIDPDLRELIYNYGMKNATMSEWDQLWNIYLALDDPQEMAKIRRALAAPRNAEILKKYLKLAKDEKNIRTQDYLMVLQEVASNPVGCRLVWSYVRRRWPELVARYSLNSRYLGNLIPAITADFNKPEEFEEMLAFFEEFPESGAGRAGRDFAQENVWQNIRWTTHHLEVVKRTLQEHVTGASTPN